jgi:hypothetical protein
LGYASRAILGALIEELISNRLTMPGAASKGLGQGSHQPAERRQLRLGEILSVKILLIEGREGFHRFLQIRLPANMAD